LPSRAAGGYRFSVLAAVLVTLAALVAAKALVHARTRRIPVAVGPETMIGRRVDVVAACRPDGKVRLSSERWNASCREGADIGDTVVVERVDQLTLIVSSAGAQARPSGPR
jgi:membrane protein implicated in regulation of membrane protease activity